MTHPVIERFQRNTPVPTVTVLGNVHYIDTGAVFGEFGHRLTMLQFAGSRAHAPAMVEAETCGY